MHISHVSVSMDTTPSLRAVEGRPVSSTRRVVCPDTHVWSDMICASQPHVPTRLRLARPCLRRTGCLCCAPPSSRHESPHALLNTRWRVMRRGTDAPPLLRAPAAQSRTGTALAQTSHTPRLPQPLVQLMKPCQPFAPRDIRSHGLPRDIRPALHDRALRALGQPGESCGRARGAGGAGGSGGRGRCGVSWRG